MTPDLERIAEEAVSRMSNSTYRSADIILSALIQAQSLALEEAAKVCEKRAELRFQENGTTEWDTGASYYGGSCEAEYTIRDEEDEDCAFAIRAMKAKLKEGK